MQSSTMNTLENVECVMHWVTVLITTVKAQPQFIVIAFNLSKMKAMFTSPTVACLGPSVQTSNIGPTFFLPLEVSVQHTQKTKQTLITQILNYPESFSKLLWHFQISDNPTDLISYSVCNISQDTCKY